ncbi:MAG: CBS domain-containing protein [Thermodesulfovibrionales bacterium]
MKGEEMDWIEDEDLREALRQMRTYIDITEEDLKKIFNLALEHAKSRLRKKIFVKDVMTEKVITVNEDMTLDKVAEILTENRISGVPVTDLQNRVTGIITEADIISQAETAKTGVFKELLRHLLGEPVPRKREKSLSELKVKNVMTVPVITASPDMDIREVARILDERRIKRLPVVDREGKLIGIISRQDIVRFLSHESQ